MTKRNELTWEARIINIVTATPGLKAIEIVDRLSQQTHVSSRYGTSDACRTVQEVLAAGHIVRTWDATGECLYFAA